MKLNKMASLREFVEQMPTQELDAMLQAELQKENIDEDLVRLILDVLESREMDCPVEYIPEAVKAAQKLENIGPRTTAGVKYPRVLKAASILLVAGLLLFALPRVAHAENLFELIARWTDSVFEFFNPAEPNDQPEYVFKTDHPGLQQIYDAVVEMGVTDPVVPMWLPDSFELAESKVIKTPSEKHVYAIFKNESDTITFRLCILNEKNELEYYKDETNAELYEYNAVTHYILRNVDRQIAMWKTERTVCSVTVGCQEETLYAILESIYITEEN